MERTRSGLEVRGFMTSTDVLLESGICLEPGGGSRPTPLLWRGVRLATGSDPPSGGAGSSGGAEPSGGVEPPAPLGSPLLGSSFPVASWPSWP